MGRKKLTTMEGVCSALLKTICFASAEKLFMLNITCNELTSSIGKVRKSCVVTGAWVKKVVPCWRKEGKTI